MGAIYEVIHIETQRRRALKIMLPHVLRSVELRERFKREARVAAEVESEFIVDVFDAGVDDTTQMPFLVMELLRGEELGKRLKRVGRLPSGEALAYLYQTALALDKTHRASIVHRDLKPENIFLMEREDGPPRVKVLDFGVAKLLAEGATSGGSTEVVGTPTYMGAGAVPHGHADHPGGGRPTRSGSWRTRSSWARRTGRRRRSAATRLPSPSSRCGGRWSLRPCARRGRAWSCRPRSTRGSRPVTAVDPAHRYAMASAAVRALGEVLKVHLATGIFDAVRITSDAMPIAQVPSVGPPSYSATVREPKTALRPVLLAVAVLAFGAVLALGFGVYSWQQGRAPAADAAGAAPSALDAPPGGPGLRLGARRLGARLGARPRRLGPAGHRLRCRLGRSVRLGRAFVSRPCPAPRHAERAPSIGGRRPYIRRNDGGRGTMSACCRPAPLASPAHAGGAPSRSRCCSSRRPPARRIRRRRRCSSTMGSTR